MCRYAKVKWCPGEDSNLHDLRHWYLKPARLPIPPPGHRRRDKGPGLCLSTKGAAARAVGSCDRKARPVQWRSDLSAANSCREKVGRSQRLAWHFWRRRQETGVAQANQQPNDYAWRWMSRFAEHTASMR